MVGELIEYLPYTAIARFRKEIGKYVDDKEVARLEQYVYVPINLNSASDETLLSIPGITPQALYERSKSTVPTRTFRSSAQRSPGM